MKNLKGCNGTEEVLGNLRVWENYTKNARGQIGKLADVAKDSSRHWVVRGLLPRTTPGETNQA